MEAGREFQFLEVIGTNVLANEVVRHFSNLTAKECWECAKRKHALGGIQSLFLSFNFYILRFSNKLILLFYISKSRYTIYKLLIRRESGIVVIQYVFDHII